MHGGDEECIQKGRHRLVGLGIDGRILKWILGSYR
jgi:hypothetical protein